MVDNAVFDFGIRLQELRKSKSYTQKDVANKIGVSTNTISGYENNTQEPLLSKALLLANLYNVSVDFIAGKKSDEVLNLSKHNEKSKRILKLLSEELEKADDQ